MSNAGTNLRDADVSALIGVTQRLSDLMTAEITALRAMRPKDMRPLQDEKAKLTSRYDADLRLFSEHSDDMIKVDPALVEELKQSTATLRTILVHNKLALAAARSVNEALVHTIAKEIARQRNPAESYGDHGQVVAPTVARPRDVGPLSLDQRV